MINLFSKRQKKLRGEVPEVYTYDDLNDNLRTQIIYAFNDAFDKNNGKKVRDVYEEIRKILLREYGLLFLANNQYDDPEDDFLKFYFKEDDFEKVIIKPFDLALRKFITGVNDKQVTNRIPEVSYDKENNKKQYTYTLSIENKELYQRLYNAFEHLLFLLQEEKPDSKELDPFAPHNYKTKN